MVAKLRDMLRRFTDWTPQAVTVTPPADTKDAGTDRKSAGTAVPRRDRAPTKASRPPAKAEVGGPKTAPMWRLAKVTNPKTNRPTWVQVNKDGSLAPSDARRLGVSHVQEWHEVRAPSQRAARLAIQGGQAEARTRNADT